MAKRHLRIPDDLNESLDREGAPRPLWYVGTLQAENGQDLLVEPVPPDEAVPGAPLAPIPVIRPNMHPDDPDAN